MCQGELMRGRRIVVVLAGAVALWCAAPLAVSAAPGAWAEAGTAAWGKAIEVPGLGSLNQGGNAEVLSVSCATSGNCSAGGIYADESGDRQAFVVSEKNSTWGSAIEVPGTATLNTGGTAEVNSVSCASAGNCSAGGSYTDGSGHVQAFVVSEKNGTWGTAIEVPGTATLNAGGTAEVHSVSCATSGNCSAGGGYRSSGGGFEAFVVSEKNGTWATAIEVPGSGTLNTGGDAVVWSVSCGTAGNCAAGGTYYTKINPGHSQAFVVSQKNGTWGTAIEVPGTATTNSDGIASVASVSCASAGNCVAGGSFFRGSGAREPFVVSETDGTWGTETEVLGSGSLNTYGGAVSSVSCASAGNCSAGGIYSDSAGNTQVFVVSETDGTWGTAIEVPGTATLNAGGDASIGSVSCASAGNCVAAGSYAVTAGHSQAFVASETDGTWGTAIEVPGTATLNAGTNAKASSVSCAKAGNCAAGGFYTDSHSKTQGFVVSQT
jgi:hypothetical protein